MLSRQHNTLYIIRNTQPGFTLIELLVVIGIITILATVVLVAVNPNRQFMNARDTQRRTDLSVVTSALVQYQIDNEGKLPDQSNFPSTATCVGTVAPCVNLGAYLIPLYIPELPYDPSSGTPANTQYFIYKSATRQLVATASGEITSTITVAR